MVAINCPQCRKKMKELVCPFCHEIFFICACGMHVFKEPETKDNDTADLKRLDEN